MKLIDSHCHIQFNAYKDDADEVIGRAIAAETFMIAVGSQNSTSRRAVEYAKKYPKKIWAVIGLHPVHLTEQEVDEEEIIFKTREEKFDFEFYKKLAQEPEVVGIGECGLDFYHLPLNHSLEDVKKIQEEAFYKQVELADEMNLPLVIHCRAAHFHLIPVLQKLIKQGKVKNRGVAHCFTGNWLEAKAYLDLGFYIGLTGVICFPPKKNDPQPTLDLLEVAKNTPLDSLLVETDAPYLAPPPFRGKRNEPAYVRYVVEKIAEIKGETVEKVAQQTVKNTLDLFKKIKL